MTEFQTDLVGFSDKDVSDYTPDLTVSLREAADEAASELDFGQRIRGALDGVMTDFEGVDFDYVDTEIGTITVEDVESELEAQALTFDDVPFSRTDVDDGGQRPDAVVGAAVVDYKAPGKLATSSGRRDALGQLAGYMVHGRGRAERRRLGHGRRPHRRRAVSLPPRRRLLTSRA